MGSWLGYQRIDSMLPEGQPSKLFAFFFSFHAVNAVNRKTRI
jgi:hypothetical protein